jgi:hypothetical protein
MYVDDRERLRRRAERISAWLEVYNEAYEELISRPEETASITGFDHAPHSKPCEHRLAWMMGNLCLACDNTGWRPLAKGEVGVDPYAADISGGVTVVRDESPAVQQAREAERLTASIAALERNARIRAGLEVREDRDLRNVRIVSRRPRILRKIGHGLEVLRTRHPGLYAQVPHRTQAAMLALAMLVPGRIDPLPYAE